MSQYDQERNAYNSQDTQPLINSGEVTQGTYRYKARKAKKKKNHPVLIVLLATILGFGAGTGGALMVWHFNGTSSEPTVIHYADEGATSSQTNSGGNTALTVTEIAAKASPSVVEILISTTTTTYGIFGGTYVSQAAGSGVIISSDGFIITNHHVVEGASAIQVTLYDGTVYDAVLVGSDSESDIAVIKINGTNLIAATIGDSSAIQAGDTAVAIGNPLGTLGGTVTDGIISAPNREITVDGVTMELIQTNCAVNEGNSGGGLFDGNGNLIGIVNMKDSGTTSSGAVIEGLGFAIPINTAIAVAEELIANGKVTGNNAELGVYVQQLTTGYGNYPAGVYITGIKDNSGAQEAGLQVYDRIVSIDGKEVTDSSTVSTYLKSKSPGDTVTLVISRNGKEISVKVTLSSSES